MNDSSIHLVVRRTIQASAQRLFAAWTTPEALLRWWGPKGVTCTDAAVDLRVGGSYRLANQLPTGDVVLIHGRFETVSPPHKLVYTWSVDAKPELEERVTVRFEPREQGTEVIVVHERIASIPVRDQHHAGWLGCLEGLDAHCVEEAASIGNGLA